MSATLIPAETFAPAPLPTKTRSASPRPLGPLAQLGPNWFAAPMGTAIIAISSALLPHRDGVLHAAGVGAWALAAAMLIALLLATAAQWLRYPAQARAHAENPRMAPFYGAPPMAFLAVGSATLLCGDAVLGTHAALIVDAALWSTGALTGVLCAVLIPYLMFTHHRTGSADTYAFWLMPVVPPMVAASTGATLSTHLPAGQLRLDGLLVLGALFGVSLVASLVTVVLVWARLAWHGPGPSALVPTLWIVLGPFGQSVTAANLLAAAVPGRHHALLGTLALVYGVPVWGFGVAWLAIAAAVTLRTARAGLPFTLTWWSFTFPVGTMVTGTSELAVHTGSAALGWIAVALFAGLVAGWAAAAGNTARGLRRGTLLAPPAPVADPVFTES